MDKQDLRRAQSNMMTCIGIAIGIEGATSGAVNPKKSYFENAVDIMATVDEDLLKSMTKALQEYINDNS